MAAEMRRQPHDILWSSQAAAMASGLVGGPDRLATRSWFAFSTPALQRLGLAQLVQTGPLQSRSRPRDRSLPCPACSSVDVATERQLSNDIATWPHRR